ncbi:GNAT family N-acetyltransferase [Psychrobacter sp. I-STPA6b]|uniref:GNAT family N-acetyltransferase n=1 Tax=Psychrobacter sp. I-STPA6b TaxID=2585718 RepID=UPI001D0C5033|nr:GNAT family N-acetyltransferase [Psychrobacter sp. I-STPA6b]
MKNSPYHVTLQTFTELTNHQLLQILQARCQVFIIEQQCIYQDIDGIDPQCLHISMVSSADTSDTNNHNLVAYCRIIPPALSTLSTSPNPVIPAIGRVLVTAEHRGQGLARKLMQYAIDVCQRLYPNQPIYISAQTYLTDFYQSLGFVVQGKPYDEDGIEHIDMLLD